MYVCMYVRFIYLDFSLSFIFLAKFLFFKFSKILEKCLECVECGLYASFGRGDRARGRTPKKKEKYLENSGNPLGVYAP